ncbi:MAG: peptidoglycan-binding protein [Candidatus Pacearchaeota archaeon]
MNNKKFMILGILVLLLILSFSVLAQACSPGNCANEPILSRGSTGDCVGLVQDLLNEKNYGPLKVDCIFGPQTETVVRDFQLDKDLTIDGVVGPKTWRALKSSTGGGEELHVIIDTDPSPPEGDAPLTVEFFIYAEGGTPPYRCRVNYAGGHGAGEHILKSSDDEFTRTNTYKTPGNFNVDVTCEDSSTPQKQATSSLVVKVTEAGKEGQTVSQVLKVEAPDSVNAGDTFQVTVKKQDVAVEGATVAFDNGQKTKSRDGTVTFMAPSIPEKEKTFTITASKIENKVQLKGTKTITVKNQSGTETSQENGKAAEKIPPVGTLGCFELNTSGLLKGKGINFPYLKNFSQYFWTCIYQAVVLGYSLVEAGWYVWGTGGGWGSAFPEQALAGTKNCDQCNKPYTVCTQERCNILGTCKWVEKSDKSGGVCMEGICEPTSVPKIEDMKAKFYIDRTTLNRKCPDDCTLKTDNNGRAFIVNQNISWKATELEINVTLNQKSKCKYVIDKRGASFEEMQDFDENQFYPEKQSVLIDISQLELGTNHTVYIKCEGTCGQAHDPGFDWNYIRFEFDPKPDLLPPVIVQFVPDPLRQHWSNESRNGDWTETIEVWLDETGDCKFSTPNPDGSNCGANLTTNWSNMCDGTTGGRTDWDWNIIRFWENDSAQCCSAQNAEGEVTCYEKYDCTRAYLKIDKRTGFEIINWTNLNDMIEAGNISEHSNIPPEVVEEMLKKAGQIGFTGESKVFKYMFRCQDDDGNKMDEQDSRLFVIMTYPPYDVNITIPPWDGGYETFERQPEIEVNTSRVSQCKYSVHEWPEGRIQPRKPDWNQMSWIDEEFSLLHHGKINVTLNATREGLRHIMYVKCRDYGGLEVEDDVTFKIKKDETPPEVIRIYRDPSRGILVIETNEESACAYSTRHANCGYNFSDGNILTSMDGFLHGADWLANTYYIKCKDKWDNYPGPSGQGTTNPAAPYCTTIIYPYEIPEFFIH